jgi:hypothetical protein
MRPLARPHLLARALVLGLTGTVAIGVGTASAAPPDPVGGATPVAPHFYNGNVEAIGGAGF